MVIRWLVKNLKIQRFPNDDGIGPGQAFTLKGAGNRRHHFTKDRIIRLIVKSGQADKPILRYKMFYFAGCNTDRYYYEVFQHGTIFLTNSFLNMADSGPLNFVRAIIEKGEDAAKIEQVLESRRAHSEKIIERYSFGG